MDLRGSRFACKAFVRDSEGELCGMDGKRLTVESVNLGVLGGR